MKSQLLARLAGRIAVVLGLAALPAAWGQTTNLINDGTTVANLTRLQNQSGAGIPPATLTLTPVGTELEASQSPAFSDFPLSGVWYDNRFGAATNRYAVLADARPAVGFPEYVVGVMAWLDPDTSKGIAFRVVPGSAGSFQVATIDFGASTWENNDSLAGLFQLNGQPASASVGSAWAQGGAYNPERNATLSLQIIPPTPAELALVPEATARVTTRVYQDGPAQVGDVVDLLTTLPLPVRHRFGYFASWGTSLFSGEPIGYVDNLRLVGEVKIENLAPSVAINSPTNGSRFHVPAAVTITVTTTDPEGRPTRTDLFQGDTLIASTNVSPANFVIQNLAVGTYSFTVKAEDDLGAVSESAVLNIEMLPPLQPPLLQNPQAAPSRADFQAFTFQATGLGSGAYRVESTTDYVTWTEAATGVITGPTMLISVPRNPADTYRSYRVVVGLP